MGMFEAAQDRHLQEQQRLLMADRAQRVRQCESDRYSWLSWLPYHRQSDAQGRVRK